MGPHGVSHAAALALRQLQDQLAAAYTDLATCQEENASLRADARDIIHAQHAEVVASEARASNAEKELEVTRGLLKELKTALEATLVDNAKCKAEVAQLAELRLALESCRVALDGAKKRQLELEESAAAAASAQRSAEAAAAAADRRAADVECLRQEGSSAAMHARSQLQSLQQSLQEQQREMERMSNSNALLEFRCDAAEARSDALQAEMGEAASKHAQEAASLKEKLREEEGRRKAGDEQAARMDGVLTALRQEATALRMAAEEHAKGVCEMRVTAEAAQRFLDQERGMRDALTSALQHTEITMQRVLSLNQALVESFAEPLILATCRQQQQTQLQTSQEATQTATEPMKASAPQNTSSRGSEGCEGPRRRPLEQLRSSGQSPLNATAPSADPHCLQHGCPKCLAEQRCNSTRQQDSAVERPAQRVSPDTRLVDHVSQQPADICMRPSHNPTPVDEDTLENRILPAIARHMAELQQQQKQPKQASGHLQPKQATRLRGAATFTSSSGQKSGTRGINPNPPIARGSWGVPPARKPTLASGATAAASSRKAATAQKSSSASDLLKTREQVESVVMSLEDELAVLDLRYADLLRQQQRQRQHGQDRTIDLGLEEEVAHAAAKVRKAMQRKGQQIQQLRQYTANLKT